MANTGRPIYLRPQHVVGVNWPQTLYAEYYGPMSITMNSEDPSSNIGVPTGIWHDYLNPWVLHIFLGGFTDPEIADLDGNFPEYYAYRGMWATNPQTGAIVSKMWVGGETIGGKTYRIGHRIVLATDDSGLSLSIGDARLWPTFNHYEVWDPENWPYPPHEGHLQAHVRSWRTTWIMNLANLKQGRVLYAFAWPWNEYFQHYGVGDPVRVPGFPEYVSQREGMYLLLRRYARSVYVIQPDWSLTNDSEVLWEYRVPVVNPFIREGIGTLDEATMLRFNKDGVL